MAARIIEIERVTSYLRQDAIEELSYVVEMDPQIVEIPIALCIDKKGIAILMEERISLAAFMKKEASNLSMPDKMQIVRNIAEAMRYLHDEHGVLHGHLTPHNVLLTSTEELTICVSDVGLQALIKHSRILGNYKPNSVWSAPEYL